MADVTMTSSSPELGSQRSSTATVGRLAPSPTGLLHLGHARTFLIAWWSARSQGGRVVLRVEDLDGERASAEMVDAARRDLEWLGLDWDGSMVLQSEGLPRIDAALDALVERGLAYPCVCSRGEIRRALGAPHAPGGESRYPGTCRGRFSSVRDAERATGREAGLRFLVPEGLVVVEDAVRGTQSFDVHASVGDFMIGRRGGSPAYQLAVVVDDALQGITEVLRGDDLLPSAARQQLLQGALGFAVPRWGHLPLVVDAAGRRLAKREAALGLAELRARGADARRIVAWAARSCGLEDVGEATSAAEVSRSFELGRGAPGAVVRAPPLEALIG